MAWTDIATWAGTGLTIISTGVAIWKAWQAIGAATRAKELRDEIVARNTHGELSDLNSSLAAAIRAMDKYGLGANPTSLRGNSPNNDASAVRELTTKIALHKVMLTQKLGPGIDNFQSRLKSLLSDFGTANSTTERTLKGCAIHTELTEFSGNMKQELDNNRYVTAGQF